uniref:Uncharacterized protein n=1 Tax=uncultured marine virus TaxID=186617 RepID=A0A0F7L8K4_9VIRU|nr:hypothetical protein [uncultured marine virus]
MTSFAFNTSGISNLSSGFAFSILMLWTGHWVSVFFIYIVYFTVSPSDTLPRSKDSITLSVCLSVYILIIFQTSYEIQYLLSILSLFCSV